LVTATDQSDRPPVAHASFAALRHPGFQMYFLGTATAMLADNIEHVISYWVILGCLMVFQARAPVPAAPA
jgi:hypothetical protein